MKYLIGLIFVSWTFSLCGQTELNTIDGLTIASTIKDEAEKNVGRLDELEEVDIGFPLFRNKVIFEFYENDSLILSSQGKPQNILFKSFYGWRGDTLFIEGSIGLAVGSGFSIQITNGKATLYHIVHSDENPAYAYGHNTKLIHRLEVPCYDIKAILSEIPEKGRSIVIYGYVEFKSESYYTGHATMDGKEFEPREKTRANMKMYFKSEYLKF